LLCGAPTLAQTDPYSTSFPATENPISEGGIWLNGGVDGVDWGNVQTDGTHAFGVSLPSTYADPSAALKGSWAPDQTAKAVVKIVGANPTSCCHELELRLRTAITAHDIKGYEINFSVTPNSYVQIVRWNGPLANSSNSNNGFTYIATTNGPGIHDGDVLIATIRGNTITVFQNGAQILQGVDTGQGGVGPWTSGGAPGIGFFDSADNNWSNFGFASFTGSDSAANVDGGRDAGGAPPDAGSGRPDGGSGRPDAGGDSGTPGADSGSSGPDGSAPSTDAGMSNVTGGGCGCSGTGGQLAVALALLGLLSRPRARRTRVLE
jgi:uncharacterized protein (TIGR03382 family)